jgi:hypothetical protein
MGVRRLFSSGGQKFSNGGQEHTFCLKSNKKHFSNFSQKSLKTYYFWPARGARALLAHPLRTPMSVCYILNTDVVHRR